jgi:inosine/xanthosine triphosphate pyrophosphatase family protein
LDGLCEKLRSVKKQRVKKERNAMHTVKRRKANWNCQIFYRNCLLKHVTEGNTEGRREVTERGGRRRKQLLGDLTGREHTGN